MKQIHVFMRNSIVDLVWFQTTEGNIGLSVDSVTIIY